MTRAANLTKKYIKGYILGVGFQEKKIGRQLGVDRNLDVEASDIYHNEKARMEAVEQNAFQLKTDRSDLQGITKREADKTQVQPKKSQSHKKKRVNSSSTNHQATTGANNVFKRSESNQKYGLYGFIKFLINTPPKFLVNTLIESIRRILFVFDKPLKISSFSQKCILWSLENPADIYHAHDLNTLPAAFLIRKKTGGKLVYDSHELYPEISGLNWLERRLFSILESHLIKDCDHVITVNESIASELKQRYGIPKPSIVMNCPEVKQKVKSHNLIREKLDIPDDVFVVLYQGGFSAGRGIENLVLSAHNLENAVLVLMGWGRIEEHLKSLIANERLEDRVYLIPPVPQEVLLKWSSSADVGVIPYRATSLNNYYTCPNKLFEYICAGIPVAGSAFPEIKRIVERYELGLTFDPESIESISETVNSMLSSQERFKEFKLNTEKARGYLDWSFQERKLLEIYKGLNSNNKVPSSN